MTITKEEEQDIRDDEKRELIAEARDENFRMWQNDNFISLCEEFVKETEPDGFEEYCRECFNDCGRGN